MSRFEGSPALLFDVFKKESDEQGGKRSFVVYDDAATCCEANVDRAKLLEASSVYECAHFFPEGALDFPRSDYIQKTLKNVLPPMISPEACFRSMPIF